MPISMSIHQGKHEYKAQYTKTSLFLIMYVLQTYKY